MPVFRAVITIDHPSLGGTGTNTFHARTTDESGPFVSAQLDGFGDTLKTFYTTLNTVQPANISTAFNGEWIRIDDESGSVVAVDTWTVAKSGTSQTLPPANCIVVSWKTAARTRSGMGRTFIGPIVDDAMDSMGTPSPTALSTVRGAAAALIGSQDEPADGALGVWSPTGSVLRDFTAATVSDQFAVLRSRRD
uniref:Uncharacterized protein n=1 Tax=uncultured prokaryote TaxID=198431 RepID=A0A0H5Q5N7_9ZZZZ|nr:hypothetical protein [uncultured prokaryote]